MATQVISARRGVRVKALLLALVLTIAVVILATQARSLWSSTTTGSRDLPSSLIGPNPIAGHAPARFSRPNPTHFDRSDLHAAMRARKGA